MCSASDVGVIIAVKKPSAAKTRLAPGAVRGHREHIVLAMLVDTTFVRGASGIASAVVTPGSGRGLGGSRRFDATVASDPDPWRSP